MNEMHYNIYPPIIYLLTSDHRCKRVLGVVSAGNDITIGVRGGDGFYSQASQIGHGVANGFLPQRFFVEV